MTVHYLKILPEYFRAVNNGTKTFELRKDDRDYCVGDILVLQEWDPEFEYSGLQLVYDVMYTARNIEKFGLMPGYVILGIKQNHTYMGCFGHDRHI